MSKLVLDNLVDSNGNRIVIETPNSEILSSLEKIQRIAKTSAQNFRNLMASDPNNEGEIVGGSLRKI